MPKKIIIIMLITTLLTCTQTSRAGQEGHGGDMAAALFLSVTYKLNDQIVKLPMSTFPTEGFLDTLNKAIHDTTIYSEEHVYLKDVEVDAINFPDIEQPRIILNRYRWLNTSLNYEIRSHLVLHEYLSIMGFNDSRYEISSAILSKVFTNNQPPSRSNE